MKTIPLTKGYFTKVDDDDYEKFAINRWYADASRLKEIRAVRSINIGNKKIKRITLSRAIMNCPDNLKVDHINHDTLDNRKCNLRICTQAENCRNRVKQGSSISQYKGVHRQGNGWVANIRISNESIYLGYFKNERDAGLAYNKASIKYHGKFAFINQIKLYEA